MNKTRSIVSRVSLSLLHILIVLGMVFAPGTNRVLAQEANPPTATPQPTRYALVPEALGATDAQPAETLAAEPSAEAIEESADASEAGADEGVQPESVVIESLPTPNTGAHIMQINAPQAPQVQGEVQLDVSVPDTTMAGETLTYTYRYSNTTAFAVNNVVVDASWSNFIGSNLQQRCYDTGCLAILVSGPSVITTTPPATANMRYLIGTLAGNQSGQFSVIMRIDAADYPKTAQAIARPAGSGKLYRDNNYGTIVSDDTANTMIVGPVLVLTKTATSISPIYTGEPAEFNIRLGNASATGDQVGGSIRADARVGTNVILQDTYPKGSVFVSATGPYVNDPVTGLVTWTFASMATGSYQDLKVIFRKIDSEDDCTKLENDTYEATSNEYPFQNASKRYSVKGSPVSVPVVPPLQTPFITPTVSTLYYGNETIITITVRNHYTAALSNVVMKYALPENLGYLESVGVGEQVPVTIPATSLDGDVYWRFDMPPATTKTIPAVKTFAFRARAGFFSVNYKGTASIVSSGSINLPITCAFKVGGPEIKPRLHVVKNTTEPERFSNTDDTYRAKRGDDFPFVITITNRSQFDAVGLIITDALPGKAAEPDANMSYIAGTGLLNGAPRDPDLVTNGYAGKLIWQNLTVPAHSFIVIQYKVDVQGRDFYEYCNTAAGGLAAESFEYGLSGEKGICIKINPEIEMYKVANPGAAGPGEEVVFTLRITNNEAQAHTMGLFDKLNKFAFVRQISGYAQPVSVTSPLVGLSWPLVTVNPGESLEAQIVARMPDENCAQTQYDNELLFRFVSEGASYLVERIPNYIVSVKCAAIQSTKTADRTTVSLRDLMTFTLALKNLNPSEVLTNVSAVDLLPLGFTFVANAPTSEIQTVPTQTVRPDGRTELTWQLGNVGGGQTRNIRFWARASETVGSFENWLTSYSSVSRRCISNCRAEIVGGSVVTYTALPLVVQAMNTIAPQVLETTCARPNDTRTYRLTMVNTNVHSYENITITVALPMGLRFSRAISNTATPQVISETNGAQTVRWVNQRINPKPSGVFASQVEYWIEMKVGNVLGDLPTVASAISPDGLIPRKDDATDPSVPMCAPTVPTMVKAVNVPRVPKGNEVVYQITLANPTASPINTAVSDPLPGGFGYLGMVSGPEPTVSGGQLTWDNLLVPAAGAQPGLTKLVFRAQTATDQTSTYTNTAGILASPVAFDTTNASTPVVVEVPLSKYMGMVFNDINANGVMDVGESGLAGITVTLIQNFTSNTFTQTNAQGAYTFLNIEPAAYYDTLRVVGRGWLSNTTPIEVQTALGYGETKIINFGLFDPPLISISDATVTEGNSGTKLVALNITLSKPAIPAVSVDYQMGDVTAEGDFDYTAPNGGIGRVTIPAGGQSTIVTATIFGDTASEQDETFHVYLSNPVYAALLDDVGAVTIVNDDAVMPELRIAGSSLLEGNSGSRDLVFTVTLTAPSQVPVTVSWQTVDGYAVAGSDYVAANGTLVIPANTPSRTIAVKVLGDTVFEADEVFSVRLQSPVNAALGSTQQQYAAGNILNDDAPVFITPTIRISNSSGYEGNFGDGRLLGLTVTLSSATGYTVSVDYDTIDNTADFLDYDYISGTLTFPPGRTWGVILVSLDGDSTYEPDETLSVFLSNPVRGIIGIGAALGTILNDDLPPGVVPRAYLPMLRK